MFFFSLFFLLFHVFWKCWHLSKNPIFWQKKTPKNVFFGGVGFFSQKSANFERFTIKFHSKRKIFLYTLLHHYSSYSKSVLHQKLPNRVRISSLNFVKYVNSETSLNSEFCQTWYRRYLPFKLAWPLACINELLIRTRSFNFGGVSITFYAIFLVL